ncbi:MAG: type IV pilus twitching motility protein PilT [Holdemania massiliensis]
MDLQGWMDQGRAMDCTDLHLTVGLPVVARMLGELTIIGDEPLTKEEIHAMLATVMNRAQQEEYQKGDLDFGFQDAHGYSVRVNAYYQKGNPCAALRLLRNTIPTFDDLMIPEAVRKLSTLPRGLVLVTGPTGSGKSTTMAAMINSISHSRKAHIITIEDPIEYRFDHASGIVTSAGSRG